ncbi:MAG: acetate--CoA ligase family protein [Desulfamplus sp.]|nr:acetate--CoA ligase family protein [Desulfamplus sp.]
MKLYVKLEDIRKLFDKAAHEKRKYLFEYEVYELISLIGGETPLKYHFFDRDGRLDDEILLDIPGDKVVIKIVSPDIVHKSDVGGVKVVNKTRTDILSAIRNMMYEVPEKQSAIHKNMVNSKNTPDHYLNLDHEELVKQIHNDIRGVIICEFLSADGSDFGNELLVSLRRTREFGMVLTAGLGGTNTELYAQRFRQGEAVVSASTEMVNADEFFSLYKKTISFDKLTGVGRGEKRKVTDEQLKECFAAMIMLANHFSPLNPDAPYVIDELEINPFAFYRYLMVPLDGLCQFSMPSPAPLCRPIARIDKLIHPQSIAIIGVSAKSLNPGRIILQNIIANGFDKSKLFIIHPGTAFAAKEHSLDSSSSSDKLDPAHKIIQIEGVSAIASISELKATKGKVDLLILAVGANMVESLVGEIIENDIAQSVIMIPGGLGEVAGSQEKGIAIEHRIKATDGQFNKLDGEENGRPIFLGGNSLGVLSNPGRYDALFIPEDKLPKSRGDYTRHTAFISQSGAYMITRMSKLSFMDPAYAISIGNQMDLTAGDIMCHFKSLPDITTIASYMEGFRDLYGLQFTKAVKDAVRKGKDLLFYKAGRTEEGKIATSGHTASLAGDYSVCKSCVSEAGAMVANTFTEFEGLVRLSCALHGKEIAGNRLAGVSNAGYESVGIADNILGEDFQFEMAEFTEKTRISIQDTLKKSRLTNLVDIKNPMDVTPMAGEDVYEKIIEAFLNDPNVDTVVAAIVPLTPVMETLPEKGGSEPEILVSEKSIAKRIPRLAARYHKPVIMVVDSGELYDPLARALQREGLAVFRSADQAVYVLGKYIKGRLKAKKIIGLQ